MGPLSLGGVGWSRVKGGWKIMNNTEYRSLQLLRCWLLSGHAMKAYSPWRCCLHLSVTASNWCDSPGAIIAYQSPYSFLIWLPSCSSPVLPPRRHSGKEKEIERDVQNTFNYMTPCVWPPTMKIWKSKNPKIWKSKKYQTLLFTIFLEIEKKMMFYKKMKMLSCYLRFSKRTKLNVFCMFLYVWGLFQMFYNH